MFWKLSLRILCSSLIFVTCFVSNSIALEQADCIAPGDHDAMTFLMIDRSDKLEKTTNLIQSLTSLQKMIQPGERLLVGASTDKVSDTRIIVDIVRPKQSMWVSKLRIRAEEKKFDDCFNHMKSKVQAQDESYDSSAILETLSFVSKSFATDSSPKKRLVIFSDMMQNTSAVSFYRGKNFSPESQLKVVEKEFLVTSLPQVEVQAVGVGTGITDKKARAIEHFWKLYFDKAGATLKFFGPVLLAS